MKFAGASRHHAIACAIDCDVGARRHRSAWPVCEGDDGKDGAPGTPGAPGANGRPVDGPTGATGSQGPTGPVAGIEKPLDPCAVATATARLQPSTTRHALPPR